MNSQFESQICHFELLELKELSSSTIYNLSDMNIFVKN